MTEPARRGRNLRAYRRKAARLRRASAVCWLCGEAIDVDLPQTHPRSWTADHVEALAAGGDILGEIRPAHLSCNSSRGAGPRRPPVTPSRMW